MNEAFERYQFPCSRPKKIFIPRSTGENTDQRFAVQLHLDKLTKDIDTMKKRKRKYVTLLADELITQNEYREMVDANNTELNELGIKKNELVSEFEHEMFQKTLVS